jgi:hypothetical protein
MRTLGAVLALAVLLAGKVESAESLNEIRERHRLDIEKTEISVSGVSAGGWMAHQLHIIHASNIKGAAIVAAGPYHCAGSPSFTCNWAPYGWFWPHDTCQATHICSSFARNYFGFPHYYFGPPDHEDSLSSSEKEAERGTIDPIGGLKGDRVWLFTGESDRMVPQEVVEQLRQYYEALFAHADVQNPPGSIAYVDDQDVEHSMVIHVPGSPEDNRCLEFSQPYINDCDFDAAGRLLSHIHQPSSPDEPGLVRPQHGDWKADNLLEFDQTGFFNLDGESISMHAIGHLYVPEACQNGASCRLHVALHGCDQHQEAVESDECVERGECPALFFFKDAGYNEWAEKNNIVVLYPQNTPWGGAAAAAKNPHSCWDWWGYSDGDYFRRSGKQIRAIAGMINALVGQDLLLPD